MKKITVILLVAIAVLGAKADDFGLWTGVGFGQNLGVKGLSADAELGFRANNNLRNVDRWSAGLGLNYSLCKYLKVGVSYTYLYSYTGSERKEHYKDEAQTNWNGYNQTNAFWRSKNRLAVDLKTSVDVGRFSFGLRERYQLTGYNSATTSKDKYRFTPIYDMDDKLIGYSPKGDPEREPVFKEHKTKEYLRSKIDVSYNIRRCPVDPAASVELSNNIRDGFHIDKVRYSVGAEYKMNKKVAFDLFYHFNDGHDDDVEGNLHAIELSVKFKNLFGRYKK